MRGLLDKLRICAMVLLIVFCPIVALILIVGGIIRGD